MISSDLVPGGFFMAYDTFIAYAAEYPSLDDAKTDFKSLKEMFGGGEFVDVYDAALIERKSNGKVHIVDTHEDPRGTGGILGVGTGLAVGLVAAIFPGVALGGALLTGAVGGGVIGAIAGHVTGGMSRSDLKDVGEYLDRGEAGVVVIASADLGKSIDKILTRTTKISEHELKVDKDLLKKEAKEEKKMHESKK